jgi:hypothetical protein
MMRCMIDTQDGTYMREYSQEDCPDSNVQLYLGNIKVLSNSNTSYAALAVWPPWKAVRRIKWQDWN